MAEEVRAFALHDPGGSIATLIIGPSDGPTPTVVGEVDQVVTEVSVTESGIDLSGVDSEDNAAKIVRQYRIENGKLVRVD
jgi:hypothetical protein